MNGKAASHNFELCASEVPEWGAHSATHSHSYDLLSASIPVFHERMSRWKHVVVKDSTDEYSAHAGPVKDDVLSLFDPAKTWIDRTAGSSKTWQLSDADKAFHETLQINLGLFYTPLVSRVVGDIGEVKCGQG